MNDQQEYFDASSHRYQHALTPAFSQQLELSHLERALGLHPKTVLDFGSGSGRVAIWFLKKGCDVTAVDVSKQSLLDLQDAYKRRKSASWGTLRIATRLPDATFDAVVGADVLHHVDIREYLPKLASLLAPGGRIAFSEPNAWHIPWYLHWMKEGIPWHIEQGVLQCTMSNLRAVARLAGLGDIRIDGHGLIPTRLLEVFPGLCTYNALTLGNVQLLRLFAFRFILTARK